MAKENPHYEDAPDIIEEDGAEISRLRATIAEQAPSIARLEGERERIRARVAALEGIVLAAAGNDPAVFRHLPVSMPNRGQSITKALAAEDGCISAGAEQAEAERVALTARVAELEARDIPDATLDELVGWSFRYGLGRQSYAVGMIAEAVRTYRQRLLPQTRGRLMREIEEAIQRGEAGMACDVREWEAVHAALKEQP